VLILPAVTALLVFLHVYLVRRHGVAPAPVETAPPIKFYPRQVFKDTVAIFAMFALLFVLAVAVRVPLGKLADPNDVTYIPRPEWYFLFLFQVLKYFEGPLEIVGSMVLPGLAVLLLFLTPFIDRGKAIALRQRTGAIGVLLLSLIGWGALTAAALSTTPHRDSWKGFTAEEMAAIGTFRQAACWQCHSSTPGDSRPGPNLADIAVLRDRDWLVGHFKQASGPAGQGVKDLRWRQLATFLPKLDDENVESLHRTPQSLVNGAMVYQQNNCGACHQINGAGMKSGPPLNGVAKRWDRKWMEEHFLDPESKSPGTIMPAYKFSPADMTAMLDYMMSLTD
jgi:ubiquinol-cytochrome c reductase cytochrome b subunit